MKIDPLAPSPGAAPPLTRLLPRPEQKLAHRRHRPARRAKGNRTNGKQHQTRHRP